MIALMTTQRSVAYVIAAVIFVGGAAYALAQMRKGKAELGSEIELAPNRKRYFEDEELEGKRLNIALWACLGLLMIVTLTLPLYWLAEPGRQDGAAEHAIELFQHRGETLYVEGAQCVNCHGAAGAGGTWTYVITNEDGGFVDQVVWTAPALDNIFYRFDVSEVKDILTYGRPGTPMPAWGVEGGGPNTTQQLDTAIEYLWSVQKTPEQVQGALDDYIKAQDEQLHARMMAVREANEGVLDPTSDEYQRMTLADERYLGEILFSADDPTLGGNSYSCARCHVPGASFGKPWLPVSEIATGRFAFELIGIENAYTEREQFNLVFNGTEAGVARGSAGLGTGRMPGYGANPNDGAENDRRGFGPKGMMSPEQVWAVVTYTRNLSVERPDQRAILNLAAEANMTATEEIG